ncbi:MAG: RcpC/CpaB family pilus assembly protein [Planctomycetota bacterium]|nr:RcpC/CpaB family pilus assembly protein [Planctomycetota bacterium]
MTQTAPPAAPRNSTRLVIVALALAIFAVVLTNIYIESVRRDVKRNSFNIYLLNRRVQPGERLRKEDTKRIAIPRDFEQSFKELGAVMENDYDALASGGEQFQRAASANDMLLFSLFTAPGGRDLDRGISPGRRLVSLPVNPRRIPGELRPGISVDIQAAFNLGGGVPTVMTVMENVRVTAVGSRTIADERDADPSSLRPISGYRAITIEVTPEDGTYLNMIERVMIGDFDLLLRNPEDQTTKIKAGGINPEVLDIIDKRRREAPPAKR